ncbi:M1 family metallopeptidase [Candidatus Neomarinimicrobiota bacterium]
MKNMFSFRRFLSVSLIIVVCLPGQIDLQKDKFRQLKEEFATPNVYRTASGAPGHEYWQQKADYVMNIELDDENQRVYGSEIITYYNQSPDPLSYLWLQLDQNVRALDSDSPLAQPSNIDDRKSFNEIAELHRDFDGGFKLEHVNDKDGKPLAYTVNKTMLRVDLPNSLLPGETFDLNIKWWYNINDYKKIGGRSGLEYFEEEDNYLYVIAQFFPRMAVYSDFEGWQNKQFLGRGEFALTFGDYDVKITVPVDHVVAATGVLQNPKKVLTSEQRSRLKKAKSANRPVMIIALDEALENELSRSDKEATWHFKAENVRDFAFASSRKFIWDAMGVPFGDRTVMAMSFYPKEGNPLWEKYSTNVVAHTLRNYSSFTFDYPYPVAISIHADWQGMEYPMICFNGGRPEDDGTYSERTKYGMLGVIIHEVGHNYFPMIVNSDERQWTWMDEGLNTFLQYLTEQAWEEDYPSRKGPAQKIVDYMKGEKSQIMPIMTNSESLINFSDNAYGKPTTALNILRETIMGRELFDFAFKQYAQRWMFKHPTPEDFFRTMEDASGIDLDWFWRGWFYSVDHVDISIDEVNWYRVNTKDPEIEKPFKREQQNNQPENISTTRNREILTRAAELDSSLLDFYNRYDPYEITPADIEKYEDYFNSLEEDEQALLVDKYNYYEVSFSNVGGLVMPILLEFEFTDGSQEFIKIPAEVWRTHPKSVSKVFPFEKELTSINMDPYLETADVDRKNNYWPPRIEPTRFELFKESWDSPNIMKQKQKETEALKEKMESEETAEPGSDS